MPPKKAPSLAEQRRARMVERDKEAADEDALDNGARPKPVPHVAPAQPTAVPALPHGALSIANGAETRLIGGMGAARPGTSGSNSDPTVLGDFFLHNLGYFLPFMVPGLLPFMTQVAKALPPPFDYLLNIATTGGARGANAPPMKKMFHTCPPRAPPPFTSEPPPAPPLFPLRTRMPDWALLQPSAQARATQLARTRARHHEAPSGRFQTSPPDPQMTTHSWFTGPYKNNEDEPDGWRRGELTGRFTPRSSGVGKIVERYPTQVCSRAAVARLARRLAALGDASAPAREPAISSPLRARHVAGRAIPVLLGSPPGHGAARSSTVPRSRRLPSAGDLAAARRIPRSGRRAARPRAATAAPAGGHGALCRRGALV